VVIGINYGMFHGPERRCADKADKFGGEPDTGLRGRACASAASGQALQGEGAGHRGVRGPFSFTTAMAAIATRIACGQPVRAVRLFFRAFPQ